jgi:translation initiation factor 2 gamma subunit (eIF-2gamma)
MNIKKIIVLLNKIDLINDKKIILENKNEIENLFDELKIEPCSYIPTCLSKGLGINEIIYDINKYFFENIDNIHKKDPLIVLRSWDVNSVHIPYNKIKPGIIGGTGGSYQEDDKVLILPGYIINDKSYKPYELTIKNMETDRKTIYGKSKPGGLIGISFYELDPTISKNNQLVGNIMCLKTDKYDVYSEITVTIDMFPNEHILKKWKPIVNQKIYCIINAKTRESIITNTKKNNITFKFDNPICPTKNKIILLTSLNNQYIPIGIGEIKKGKKLKCIE